MTPGQRARLRRSWAAVQAEPEATTRRFYDRLFEVNPNARRLFGAKDMALQGAAFSQMLDLFMRSLDEDDPGLVEAIKACGRRHIGYGVMHSDYDSVGEALVWALEQALRPGFTTRDRDAWHEAYRSLATVMRQASSGVL